MPQAANSTNARSIVQKGPLVNSRSSGVKVFAVSSPAMQFNDIRKKAMSRGRLNDLICACSLPPASLSR